MTELEQSILDTLKYSELFNFPLTDEEVYKYLIGTSQFSFNKIKQGLNSLIAGQKIKEHNNYYYINESSLESAKMRLEWSKKVELIKQEALSELKFIKKLKFIKFVGITGSVAAKSLKSGYDIDLFIISSKNTVWLTRFVFFIYLKLKQIYKNKYCANIYINNHNLKWHAQNIYVANEIARLLPIYNKNYTYEQFLIKNKWVVNFLPNFKYYLPTFNIPLVGKTNHLLLFLEIPLFLVQYLYMKPKITTEQVSLNKILFLKNDYAPRILENYRL